MATWEKALLADMRAEADVTNTGPLTSIFFGGGTPSLMPPALAGRLISEAQRLWGFAPGIEITLEANPSSVEAANFAELAQAGVNRVSLGIQSLHNETLQWLGRLHNAEEAFGALETAQWHFKRVSFDLIYALPDQTLDQWSEEITRALGFGTSHLSLYQLTIEPSTRFETDVRRGVLNPLDPDLAAGLFTLTQELTAAAGLPAYETSNHARPGEESHHNLTYWRYQDYAGIGPGAHGRRGGFATTRHKKPENFLSAVSERGHGIAEQRLLPGNEQAVEAIMMGLRLTEGIDQNALEQRFDIAREELINPAKLKHLEAHGLIWRDQSRIGATPQGAGLLDGILTELIADGLVEA